MYARVNNIAVLARKDPLSPLSIQSDKRLHALRSIEGGLSHHDTSDYSGNVPKAHRKPSYVAYVSMLRTGHDRSYCFDATAASLVTLRVRAKATG